MVRAAVVLAAIFLVIYLPDSGHGFISDDFRWIVESQVRSVSDLIALFSTNIGFYRPVTSLSFAVDHAAWGTHPLGYGLTNLGLCLAAAAGLFMVARRIGLSPAPALLAAGVWLLNFHAINMAVLWLSGRTALLASVFSLATAWAIFDRRYLAGGILALFAMLSKEEAVALPALFTVFHLAADRQSRSIVRILPLWGAAIVYLALRAQSGAFWPSDAPSFYQFSSSPAVIGRNVLEYADRAGTVFAIVAIVLAVAGKVRWTDIPAAERRAVLFGSTWIVSTYALTIFLPVRSSLYALLPSIGSALVVGSIAAVARRAQPLRFQRAAIALVLMAALLVPVYRSRNERWVRLAELSAEVMRTIAADAARRPSGHVVLVDAPQERVNLVSAFGNLLPDALQLNVGRGWTGEIVTPPAAATRRGDLEYRLLNGALRASPEAR
jgi:hypothetical protein